MAHRLTRPLALLAAIGAASCAGIIGINDRSLDTSDGGGTGDGGGSSGGGDSNPMGDSPMGDDGGGGDSSSCPSPCTMATGLNHPFLMASDTNNVYWTEYGDTLGASNGSVKSCPVSGCGSGPTVLAMALTNPRGIAVDANNVYFATASYGPVNGAIWSCPVSGCGGSPMKIAPASIPYGIALDATYVYWVDNDDSTIHRAPKAGGSNAVLYDAGSGLVTLPTLCRVDNVAVYLSDQNGNVFREPLGGGEPTQMATGMMGGIWPVAIDDTHLYYGAPGSILAMSKSGTGGGSAIAMNIQDPDGLVLDTSSGKLYWSDWGSGIGTDGTVGKVGGDGKGQAVLAGSLITPEDVTTSGAYVLWLSNGTLADGAVDTSPNTGALLRSSK